MIAVNPNGSGPRGRLIVLAVGVVVLLLGMALIWGGCGDSAKQGTTGSQLDDEGSGGSTGSSGGGGSGGSSDGNAMVDYSWDQCTSDMTKRYGDVEKAKQVCGQLQTEYSSQPVSQLATILPTVESRVGVTPLPGSTVPGSTTPGSTTSSGGTTSPGNTDPGGGWDGQEIVVPQAP
ncbi:MAG: hypothetical protein WC911_01505 [Thermoleophilia bacterium]